MSKVSTNRLEMSRLEMRPDFNPKSRLPDKTLHMFGADQMCPVVMSHLIIFSSRWCETHLLFPDI